MVRAIMRATCLVTGGIALVVQAEAGNPPGLTRHPLSQRVMAGHGTRLIGGSADASAAFEWERDRLKAPGPHAPQRIIRHARPGDSGWFQLIARNLEVVEDAPSIGESVSRPARLSVLMPAQTPGIVDLGFGDAGLAAGDVRALVALRDGGVLAAGNFVSADGQPLGRVARLRADGTVDSSFLSNPGADRRVRALVAHRDGWIVAGDFSSYHGQPGRLVRLLADGQVDPAFVSPAITGTVRAIAVQRVENEERVLVGLAAAPWLLRVRPDGKADPGFAANVADSGLNGRVNAIAVQPDGAIVVGGAFFPENAWPFLRVGRLLPDGRADTAGFLHGAGIGADFEVMALAVGEDGRILLGGRFTIVHGQSRFYLARLLGTGQLDIGFNPSPNDTVNGLAVLPDGRVYAAGDFSRIDGAPVRTVARLAPNGARDPAWQPAAFDGRGLALALGSGDRVFIGGEFSQPHALVAALRGEVAAAAPRVIAVENPQRCELEHGAALVVAAEATPESTFTWRKDGIRLGVTQTGEWIIPRVTPDHAGTYSVEVMNPLGAATAGPFEVQVTPSSPGARPLWRGLALQLPASLPNQGLFEAIIPMPALSVEEVQVTLALEHADTNDLVIDLIAPNGQSVRLVDPEVPTSIRRGRNFDFTKFADAAPERINDAPAPCVGTFRPSADPPALATLAGPQPAGDWVLRINDLRDDENTGSLRFVAIDLFGPQPLVTRELFESVPVPSTHPDVTWHLALQQLTLRHWQPPAAATLAYDVGIRLSDWTPLPFSSLRLLRVEHDQSAASTLALPRDSGAGECFVRARWP